MRVLTHPETGIVLSVGRDRYRPPPEPTGQMARRNLYGPRLHISAARCDLDHTIAWEHGGPTALTNLTPLARGTTPSTPERWRVEQVPGSGGAVQWTLTDGRTYRVDPERRIPVFSSPSPTSTPHADGTRREVRPHVRRRQPARRPRWHAGAA